MRGLCSFLQSKGKRVVGWDEVLEPNPADLPSDTVIQSWRNVKGLMIAAKHGLASIASPFQFYYLDHTHTE